MSEDYKTAPRVFIFGPGHMPYMLMFLEYGYKITHEFWEADLVCLTGGADVHPKLYGEKILIGTQADIERDRRDGLIYHEAIEQNIPIVGICRGGQFLNVMNGGKMWQDVTGHLGSHDMTVVETGQVIKVTSTHHQMMIPSAKGIIIATANTSTTRKTDHSEVTNPKDPDIEVVFYPETDSLCFQPHPEFAEEKCRDYFFELLYEKFGETRGWFEDEVEGIGDDADLDDVPFDDEVEDFKERFKKMEGAAKKSLGQMMDTDTGEWVTLDADGNPIEGSC